MSNSILPGNKDVGRKVAAGECLYRLHMVFICISWSSVTCCTSLIRTQTHKDYTNRHMVAIASLLITLLFVAYTAMGREINTVCFFFSHFNSILIFHLATHGAMHGKKLPFKHILALRQAFALTIFVYLIAQFCQTLAHRCFNTPVCITLITTSALWNGWFKSLRTFFFFMSEWGAVWVKKRKLNNQHFNALLILMWRGFPKHCRKTPTS